MSWGNWFKDKGEHVKEKTVKTTEGRETHWLRSVGGDKQNHTRGSQRKRQWTHISSL
jgi:hypothetical protein